ncbi:hypothetical protein BDB00DRAFT_881140 [Zychaea mexicana]|uniref:uncharacterized protein n=1 Tax=Zychaea mexicana TaxID=64656 RepID=UPI0022FEBA92|nr:uncharacterized protein BDB00DRAFT_881140 [Zychaea mexicana]KAI9498675.1 hypothetical protein BDB00DRAFT_881140 [Zychaea mexicana]
MSAAIELDPATAATKNTWRGFSITETNFIDANFPDKIEGPSVWDGKELEQTPEKWIYYLTPEDIADIEAGLRHFLSLNIPLTDITKRTFPLTTFAQVIKDQVHTLFQGYGFSVVRGLDILKYERKEQAAIFMGIGAYIGKNKPQNGKGHILGHVKDLTYGSATKSLYDADQPTTRIYATRKAQPFHVDGTDVVALLCLNKGFEGGLSSVISSHTVYNRLQELRPDIVELLKEPWQWDRKGEHGPDEAPYISAAPITYFKDHLFTFWGPHFFSTMTRFPEYKVDERKFEAMEYIEELCQREALNMQLEVGDIQFVQNYQILHARTAYTDNAESARHLLRLWFVVKHEEVGWDIPFNKADYDYGYAAKRTVPLEAE